MSTGFADKGNRRAGGAAGGNQIIQDQYILASDEAVGMDLDFTEGMQFDKGYLSPYFVTDPERQEAILEEPYILLTQGKISSVQEMLPVCFHL